MIISRRSESLSAPDTEGPSVPPPGPPLPHVEGVEHRFASVNGVRLHYAAAGRGDLLVLLHGWPQHWWAWREVIPALAQRYRVICPDIRGLGWSEAGGEPGLDGLVADLVGLLDELGVGRARLAAHGLGATIGYAACLRSPDRFSHFVPTGALTPWAGGGSPLPHLRSWHAGALALLGPDAATRLRLPELALRAWRRQGRFTAEETSTHLDSLDRLASARASRHYARAVTLPTLRSRDERRLEVPTLHLNGELDPLTRGVAQSFQAHAPGMRSELVPGCGHFLAEEAPRPLLDRLEEFLA
ncbi:MAG: alpha/beta fold hydrolase [Thermoleophilaceae bacterium]